MADVSFDVVIVGHGPVSQLTVLALARQGRSIADIGRWEERYPLLGDLDHRVAEFLAANG